MKRFLGRLGAVLISAGLLAGCGMTLPTSAAVTAATTATISKAQQDLQTALNLYGVAKGIGQVASLADPALGVVVAGISAIADPVVAKAQIALNDATTDANTIEALVVQITAQANSLTVKAAPVVSIVPNPPSVPPGPAAPAV